MNAVLGLGGVALLATGLGVWLVVLTLRAARLHASAAIPPPEVADAPTDDARGAKLRALYPRWAVPVAWFLGVDLLVLALVLWSHVALAVWALASASP